MKVFSILFIGIIVFISCNKRELPQLNDGTETVEAGAVYVVHSMIYVEHDPWTTSNIYVIKGTGDTVWVYGSVMAILLMCVTIATTIIIT